MGATGKEKVLTKIDAIKIDVGEDIIFEEGVTISGIDGPAEKVVIGDNVFIGRNTTVHLPYIEIKDYTKIYGNSLISGYKRCKIGYNCWIDRNCILNATDDWTLTVSGPTGSGDETTQDTPMVDAVIDATLGTAQGPFIGEDLRFVVNCYQTDKPADIGNDYLDNLYIDDGTEEEDQYGNTGLKWKFIKGVKGFKGGIKIG